MTWVGKQNIDSGWFWFADYEYTVYAHLGHLIKNDLENNGQT